MRRGRGCTAHCWQHEEQIRMRWRREEKRFEHGGRVNGEILVEGREREGEEGVCGWELPYGAKKGCGCGAGGVGRRTAQHKMCAVF